ncbi:MAG: dienelactone hydrolase family protein [Planctomycetota bacterium]|nr:dienelactone hydrolase family protein [Planctomycetota bacterium]
MKFPTTFSTGERSSAEVLPWKYYQPRTSSPSGGAVVIAYGSDGLAPKWEPEIRRHAEALADAGILAIIPEYLQKRQAIGDGQSDTVFGSIFERHDEWSQVLRDSIIAAHNLPGINSVGLLGFSLGGFLGLRIRDSVNVIVSYFAPHHFPTFGVPPELAPLKGLGSKTNSALKALIQHGEADSLVPFKTHAIPIADDLRQEKATVTWLPHPGANHGFQGTDTANSDARDKSCTETVKFFNSHL